MFWECTRDEKPNLVRKEEKKKCQLTPTNYSEFMGKPKNSIFQSSIVINIETEYIKNIMSLSIIYDVMTYIFSNRFITENEREKYDEKKTLHNEYFILLFLVFFFFSFSFLFVPCVELFIHILMNFHVFSFIFPLVGSVHMVSTFYSDREFIAWP